MQDLHPSEHPLTDQPVPKRRTESSYEFIICRYKSDSSTGGEVLVVRNIKEETERRFMCTALFMSTTNTFVKTGGRWLVEKGF